MRVRTFLAQVANSMKFAAVAIALAATLGVVPRFDGAFAEEPAKAASSDTLWTASFKDITGAAQKFDGLKGKVSVVYFWATWCEPCQKEVPQFRALYEKYHDKGVEVVGIAVDNADKVKEFVVKNQLPFTVVYGGREAMQLSKDLGNSLGGIPFLAVIGKDGKVVESITGETADGRIEGIVAPLVAG